MLKCNTRYVFSNFWIISSLRKIITCHVFNFPSALYYVICPKHLTLRFGDLLRAVISFYKQIFHKTTEKSIYPASGTLSESSGFWQSIKKILHKNVHFEMSSFYELRKPSWFVDFMFAFDLLKINYFCISLIPGSRETSSDLHFEHIVIWYIVPKRTQINI